MMGYFMSHRVSFINNVSPNKIEMVCHQCRPISGVLDHLVLSEDCFNFASAAEHVLEVFKLGQDRNRLGLNMKKC